MKIDKKTGIEFLLFHQGLSRKMEFEGKKGILDTIDRIRCIQYDPINIVGRNPDLVLQSRIKNYRPDDLNDLLYDDRKLIEHFDKELCVFPIEDWNFFALRRKAYKDRALQRDREKKVAEYSGHVLDLIKKSGPLSSKEVDTGSHIEWYWGTRTRLSKAVLDFLYYSGEIGIHHKVNTRKYYDLIGNILPDKARKNNPPTNWAEYMEKFVLRRIGSVGLLWNRSGSGWLGVGLVKERERMLGALAEQGEIICFEIEDLKYTFYAKKIDWENFLNSGNKNHSGVSFLGPLDNLIWDREMVKQLFDFDYTWEIYTPKEKRKYGHYVLPVLYKGNFVARFEPVIDRQEKRLIVKNWWWEKGIRKSKTLSKAMGNEVVNFSRYLRVEPPKDNFTADFTE